MTAEYRVIGREQTATFGPTKNRKVAVSLLAARRSRYGDGHPWGPWRLQTREVTEWLDETGTLWGEA